MKKLKYSIWDDISLETIYTTSNKQDAIRMAKQLSESRKHSLTVLDDDFGGIIYECALTITAEEKLKMLSEIADSFFARYKYADGNSEKQIYKVYAQFKCLLEDNRSLVREYEYKDCIR